MTLSAPSTPLIAHFRVRLLGSLAVSRGDVPIAAHRWQRWVGSLFMLLLTAPDKRRPREEIIGALWPEASPRAGASNLRYIVHLLRRNLGGGEPSPVLSERGWIALNGAYTWEVDLDCFEERIAASDDEITHLQGAANLWQGEPLLDARYEDWAIPIRNRIERKWSELCLRLGHLHRESGSPDAAIEWWDRAMEHRPFDEEALEALLQVLTEVGRVPEALQRYRQYEELLWNELNVLPGANVQAAVAQARERFAVMPHHQPRSAPRRAILSVAVVPSYPLPSSGLYVRHEIEIGRLIDSLSANRDREARLLLIAGETGIGKTRVLAEVAQQARQAGALTLAGCCYEQEGQLPYGPIHDALLDHVRVQPEPLLQAQLNGILTDIARVVPEARARIAASEEAPQKETDDQRLRLFAAVAQLFERIAGEQPLVLLLDDLQWADHGTLQLLHFLVRQSQLGRVLFVGAYRDDEVSRDAPLADLIADTRQTPRGSPKQAQGAPPGPLKPSAGYPGHGLQIETVTLQPLNELEMRALLEEQLTEAVAESVLSTIHRTSGGNPFFALQMLALLREEGRLEQVGSACKLSASMDVDLPRAVRETVARRLRRLDRDGSSILQIGSVLGQEFSYRLLESLWEGDEGTLCKALDVVLDAQLLREADGGYRFPQPLLREIVYDQMPLHRRRQLHGRAGLVLQAQYGNRHAEHAAELVRHFLQADNPECAVPYAVLAGEQAEAAYAYGEAERQYRIALELAPQLTGGLQREADLLFKLGRLLKMTDRREEAVLLLGRAAELYRERGDAILEVRALVNLAKTYVRSGKSDRSVEALARVEMLLGTIEQSSPTPDLALLYDDLGNLYFRTGRYTRALATREQGADVARALGDERLLVRAEVGRTVALGMLGQVCEAGKLACELIPRAEAAGDQEALRLALAQAAESLMVAGEFGQSWAYRERELKVAEQLAGLSVSPFTRANLAQLALYLGRWDEARVHAQQALDDLRAVGSVSRSIYPLLYLGELALRQGEWKEACRSLEECVTLAQDIGDYQSLRYGQRLLAEYDLSIGDPEHARARLEPLLDRPGLEEHDVTYLLPTLGWVYLADDRVDQAEQMVSEALRRAATQENHLALMEAHRVEGMLLAHRRRWNEAYRAFTDAASLASAMPYPYAHARALADYGTALAQNRCLKEARKQWEEATTIFQRLGARKDVERLSRIIRGA